MSGFNDIETSELVFERWTIPHYAKGVEHLRDAVVFPYVSTHS
jgi:hypothetical protein